MDLEKTGKFIAECRKNQNLTQKQLADKLGILDKTISKWERGVNAPDISLLIPLAKILDVEVQEILKGKKKNKVIKKYNKYIIVIIIVILIVIGILSSIGYNKYVDLKDMDVYFFDTVNKEYEVNGFIAMNDNNSIISISKIDCVNKLRGKMKEVKLNEIEVKLLNGDEILYSINKTKEDNDNNILYFSNFIKTINFIVEEEKLDIEDIDLKIIIDFKEIDGKYSSIIINLNHKKY